MRRRFSPRRAPVARRARAALRAPGGQSSQIRVPQEPSGEALGGHGAGGFDGDDDDDDVLSAEAGALALDPRKKARAKRPRPRSREGAAAGGAGGGAGSAEARPPGQQQQGGRGGLQAQTQQPQPQQPPQRPGGAGGRGAGGRGAGGLQPQQQQQLPPPGGGGGLQAAQQGQQQPLQPAQRQAAHGGGGGAGPAAGAQQGATTAKGEKLITRAVSLEEGHNHNLSLFNTAKTSVTRPWHAVRASAAEVATAADLPARFRQAFVVLEGVMFETLVAPVCPNDDCAAPGKKLCTARHAMDLKGVCNGFNINRHPAVPYQDALSGWQCVRARAVAACWR